MSRTNAVTAVALLALAAAGCSKQDHGTVVSADVGHHRVRFLLPKGWERLDHGRQQLIRLGEEQVSLTDLGPVLPDAMVRDLQAARGVWLAGHRRDAFERVRELRSPALRYGSSDTRLAFWRPWTDVTYVPDAADSAAIGPAFDALMRGARELPDVTLGLLLQYALDLSEPMGGREISHSFQRTIHGCHWYDFEFWARVSHGYKARRAFVVDDGYLLVLSTDRGLYERLEPGFDAVLESIEVSPAGTKR